MFACAKTKTQISFAVTAQLIRAFVFPTLIVQFLFFLNQKLQASSRFVSDLVENPEDRFSRVVAKFIMVKLSHIMRKLVHCIMQNPRYSTSASTILKYEPPRGKTNNVVSEHVRHKPICTVTEKS